MEITAPSKRKETLKRLAKEEFDVLVIGGGITGAGIAWDAALRGLKVALIEKKDFGFGTSGGSSKLVHAGLRYLAYGEFGLVATASSERQLLFKLCPHQTAPKPFLIPIYKKGKNSFLKMFYALNLYDLLARFRNHRRHKFLSKEKTLELIPNIKSDSLKRSAFYWDGIMDDARVTLETILSAREKGAVIANYVKGEALLTEKQEEKGKVVTGVIAEDTLTGEKLEIKAKVVVNATGPWTDLVLSQMGIRSKLLRTTKGIHIITKRIVKSDIVLVITADDERGMFVVPFRKNYSLIGTTDTDYKGDLDHIDVTQADIDYVISAINNDLPGTITKEDLISAYSGVRPLLISPRAKSETDTSREFKIFETRPNLLTITGGKYTIFRNMAEKTVEKILKILKLEKRNYLCRTKITQLHGGEGIETIDTYLAENVPKVMKEYSLENDIAEHIVHTYGSAHHEILEIIKEDGKMSERIVKGRPHILAEIPHAIEFEMACTLSDFMIRRTQLQLIDHQGLDCAEKIADVMGNFLGWDEAEKKKQFFLYKKDLVWTA